MATVDIVRAWKDCAYRETLSDEERLALPAHPAGTRRLEGVEWNAATGGMAAASHQMLTMGCCGGLTEAMGFCSWFCGSGLADTTYGCCTPNR